MACLGWGWRQYVQQRKEHYVYKKPEKQGCMPLFYEEYKNQAE